MIPLERVDQPADLLAADSVVVLYFADRKPLEGPAALLDWRFDGQLTRMLLDGDIQGKAGEHVMLQNNGKLKADWALFVGGGKWDGLCEETHASLVRHMVSVASQAGFQDITLVFMPHEDSPVEVLHKQIESALASDGKGLRICRFCCDETMAA